MYPSFEIITPRPSALLTLGIKNLSRATVEVFIATTEGETTSIVLFKLGKYPSEMTDTGSSSIFSSWISLQDNKSNEINVIK